MISATQSPENDLAKLRTLLAGLQVRLCALHLGHGRTCSYALAAKLTGIAETSLRDMSTGRFVAGFAHWLALSQVHADFLAEPLALVGLALTPLAGGPGDGEVLALLTGASAGVAQALADGRIDHQERAALRPQLRAVARAVDGWSTGGRTGGGAA